MPGDFPYNAPSANTQHARVFEKQTTQRTAARPILRFVPGPSECSIASLNAPAPRFASQLGSPSRHLCDIVTDSLWIRSLRLLAMRLLGILVP
jgi:hypothetical protein